MLPLLLLLAHQGAPSAEKPIPPALGAYTLYHTFNLRYTYFGVLDMRSKTEYGFKSHPDNPLQKGKYEYRKNRARFLTGPFKGQSALFTLNKGINEVELDVKTKANPSGSLLVGTRDKDGK